MAGGAKPGGKASRSGFKAAKHSSAPKVAQDKSSTDIGLRERLEEAKHQLREARERQRATADVLRVISRSTFDLQGVLDSLVESAAHLCHADQSWIFLRRGELFRFVASFGLDPATHAKVRSFFLPLEVRAERGSVVGRAALEGRTVHVPDVLADSEYTWGKAQEIGGYRAALGSPLMRDGMVTGVLFVAKNIPAPFTEQQMELLTTFADQAVIAIENTRLFDEVQNRTDDLRQSLEYQTATSEVLSIISRSPTDVQPVFEAIAASALRLCGAKWSVVTRFDGAQLHLAALHNLSDPVGVDAIRKIFPRPLSRGGPTDRAILTGSVINLPDVLKDPEYIYQSISQSAGYRSHLAVPMRRDGKAVGAITVAGEHVEAFNERHVNLLRAFADQAVIAIENARLFNETQEALERQTATAEVLKVISRSSLELGSVLDTLVQTVARLCRADQVYMFHLRHDLWHLVADFGLSAEARDFFQTNPFTPGRGSTSGRAALERQPVLIPDVLQDPEYTLSEGQKVASYRTTLGIPLLREDTLIGVYSIARTRVEPFTDNEIELATTFADQAVIAIENARLFDELRERQAELRVTFDNMGDGVAMFGADMKLAAWNRNLQTMLDLPDALLISRPSFAEFFRYLAARSEFASADLEAELGHSVEDASREMRYERTRPDGRVVEVRRNPVPDGGFVLIYADITERKRAEEAIRLARDAAEKALRDLQTAQDRLIQTEKLASLGQLTAGIAHEIKNPLNFVNNFSALSAELVDEMNEMLADAGIEASKREELDEIRRLLKGNLEKVVQHGKRADSIVKNMLLHSRQGSGELRPVEINALVDESLNLAYHGARAEKTDFNITLERDFHPDAGTAVVYAQEITRVLLNLISNGVYAATRRASEIGNSFEPKLWVATRDLGNQVEIRVRDNGTGIPSDIKGKIFMPFFTTKPAGEGTGLGLSMSHDIVVKQHGGTINLETKPGSFTEFIVTLPREASDHRNDGAAT